VCEVPDWGRQLEADRVLREIAAAGLAATELGPLGFLPADPERLRARLAAHGLGLVAGFVPAVLHRADVLDAQLARVGESAATLAGAGAEVLVLAADSGAGGYERSHALGDGDWETLRRAIEAVQAIGRRHGLVVALHPHVGTVIEREPEIRRLLRDTSVSLCLDTGHLVVAGADPVEVVRAAAGRVAHVHLKDVDAELAGRVRSGAVGYRQAVRLGLYRPLGEGDVDLAAVLRLLRRGGYAGWYVIEQDLVLSEGDSDAAPLANVRRSVGFLRRTFADLEREDAPVDARPFEVVTMGRVGVDLYPAQSGVPLAEVRQFHRFLGGTATNVAVAAARHGRRSAVVTRVGTEGFGPYVRRALREFGVDDRYVGTDPELLTPIVFCELFPPDRFPIVFYRKPKAPDLNIRLEEIDLAAVTAAELFWTTGTGLCEEPSRSATLGALASRGRRRHTVHDLDYRAMFWDSESEASDQQRAALRHATVAVGNATEAGVAVGDGSPEEQARRLLALGPELVFVKLGPEGTLVAWDGGMERVEPTPVEVVNGLGAGDAFGGALCHGLLAGWDPVRIARFASAAGAYVAGQLACADAMPTEAQVVELLERTASAGAARAARSAGAVASHPAESPEALPRSRAG
jgi:5-dehydro-2-deoxygluconokinase